MNFIYKVVFNRQLGKFVVVGENAKSRTKSSKTKNGVVGALVATALISFGPNAFAANDVNPDHVQVIGEENSATNEVRESTIIGFTNEIYDTSDSLVVGEQNTLNQGGNVTVIGKANGSNYGNNSAIVGLDNDVDSSDNSAVTGVNNNLQGAWGASITGSGNNASTLNESETYTNSINRGDEYLTVTGVSNDVNANSGAVVTGNNNRVGGASLVVNGIENDVWAADSNITGVMNRVDGLREYSYWNTDTGGWDWAYDVGEGQSINLQGNNNGLRGSDLNVLGNGNATLNTKANYRMLARFIDDNGNPFYEGAIERSSVVGNENDFGSDTNILGSSNSSLGHNSNIVGGENYLVGDSNKVFGGRNNIGKNDYYWEEDQETGNWTQIPDMRYSYQNTVIGDENSLIGERNNILGSENSSQNAIRRLELAVMSLGDSDFFEEANSIADIYPEDVRESNVVGSRNIYGSYTQVLGNSNASYGQENITVGSYNYSIGEYNNIHGFDNRIGKEGYRDYYDYDQERWVYGLEIETANQNNVVGSDNTILANQTSILGDGNVSNGAENDLEIDGPILAALPAYPSENLYNRRYNYNDTLYETDRESSDFKTGVVGYENNFGQLSGILGSYNNVTGVANTVAGNANIVDADETFVGGHKNDVSGEKLNVLGQGNMVYSQIPFFGVVDGVEVDEVVMYGMSENQGTTTIGFNNATIGDGNSILGANNQVLGAHNNVVGQENRLGGAIPNYNEESDEFYPDFIQPLGNNIFGNSNTTVTDFTTVMGDNNISDYGLSLMDEYGDGIDLYHQIRWDNYARTRNDLNEEDSWGNGIAYNSAVVGYDNVYGRQSGVFGSYNFSEGFNNTLVGNANYVDGDANFIGGIENYVEGELLNVIGGGNEVYGIFNNVLGFHNDQQGFYANNVFGDMNSILYNGDANTVIGNYNIAGGYRNNIVGRDNISAQALFEDMQSGKGALYLRETLDIGENSVDFFVNENMYSNNTDVFGAENIFAGNDHLIAGQRNLVKGQAHNVIGQSNQVAGSNAAILGSGNFVESNHVPFVEQPKRIALDGDSDLVEDEIAQRIELASEDAVVVGNNNHVTNGSIAVGSFNEATGGGIAVGHGSWAENGNIALGHNITALGDTLSDAAFSVNGTGSTASRELAIGSVDELTRITGVAAGATDTDAVNVQQLREVYEALNNDLGSVKYKQITNSENDRIEYDKTRVELATAATTGTTTIADKEVSVVTDGGTVISNVATAQNADEAVNKGLLDSELALRDKEISDNAGNIATNTGNIAINAGNIATNTLNIAQNTADIGVINQTGVFFGTESVDGDLVVDRTKLVLGSADGSVLTQVKNVDRATDGTDAVNLDQAAEMIADAGRGVVRYDRNEANTDYVNDKITLAKKANTGTVKVGDKDVSVVTDGGTTIGNLATAQNADEAVNKGLLDSELAKRDNDIEQNADNIAINAGNIADNAANITINAGNIAKNTTDIGVINQTGVFFGSNTVDGDLVVDRSKLVLGTTDGSGNVTALTQIKNVARAIDGTDAINLDQAQEMFDGLDFGGIVRYDRNEANTAYVKDRITLGNAATVGVEKIGDVDVSVVTAGGTTISNLANAETADQAVNKGQMDSAFAKLNDEIGTIRGAIQYEILENGDVNYGASILKGDKVQITTNNAHNISVVEGGGTKIKNLANAEFADEAVNLGQMNLAIANITDLVGETTLGAVQYDIQGGVVNYSSAKLRGMTAMITTDENNVKIVEEGGTVIANVGNATKADEAVNLGVLQSSLKPVEINVEQNTNDIGTINSTGLFFASSVQGGNLLVDRSKLVLGTTDVNGDVVALTQLKNVAKADSRTDAVNLGQVQDMFDALPTVDLAGTVKYDVVDGETNLNKVTLAGGEEGTIVSNVADAVDDKDAVNLGQMNAELEVRDGLIATNTQNIATNTANIAVNTANITDIQQTGLFFGRVDGAVDKSILTLANGGTRITNVADAETRSDAVNWGQVLDLFGNVPTEANLAGMVRYDQKGDGSYNKDSLTLEGTTAQTGTDKNGVEVVTSGGTTISNVANAERADQAINKGQFDSGLADLKAGTVQYDRDEDGNVDNSKITLGGETGTVITNVGKGKIEIGSTDAVNGGQIAELFGSIEIPEQLVTQDPVSKNINVATNKDGKVVNVGGTEGNRVITGVADGKISADSNEAITGKQLNNTNVAMAQYLGGGAKWSEDTQSFTQPSYSVSNSTYHDVGGAIAALDARDAALDTKINNLEQSFTQQIDATNRHINNVEKRMNAGIASAMSMEAAPFVAGKFSYAVGAAHHGGEQAVGATFRHTADSGRWSITTGFAKATQGDASVRVGISGVID